MARFAPKHPKKVDDAIRTAVAEGIPTGKILARLRAGTLDELDGEPIVIPDRTFYRKLFRRSAPAHAGAQAGG